MASESKNNSNDNAGGSQGAQSRGRAGKRHVDSSRGRSRSPAREASGQIRNRSPLREGNASSPFDLDYEQVMREGFHMPGTATQIPAHRQVNQSTGDGAQQNTTTPLLNSGYAAIISADEHGAQSIMSALTAIRQATGTKRVVVSMVAYPEAPTADGIRDCPPRRGDTRSSTQASSPLHQVTDPNGDTMMTDDAEAVGGSDFARFAASPAASHQPIKPAEIREISLKAVQVLTGAGGSCTPAVRHTERVNNTQPSQQRDSPDLIPLKNLLPRSRSQTASRRLNPAAPAWTPSGLVPVAANNLSRPPAAAVAPSRNADPASGMLPEIS